MVRQKAFTVILTFTFCSNNIAKVTTTQKKLFLQTIAFNITFPLSSTCKVNIQKWLWDNKSFTFTFCSNNTAKVMGTKKAFHSTDCFYYHFLFHLYVYLQQYWEKQYVAYLGLDMNSLGSFHVINLLHLTISISLSLECIGISMNNQSNVSKLIMVLIGETLVPNPIFQKIAFWLSNQHKKN